MGNKDEVLSSRIFGVKAVMLVGWATKSGMVEKCVGCIQNTTVADVLAAIPATEKVSVAVLCGKLSKELLLCMLPHLNSLLTNKSVKNIKKPILLYDSKLSYQQKVSISWKER